ncbi:MAG: SufS family cysteine desulfurase [Motiliproteus sp.]
MRAPDNNPPFDPQQLRCDFPLIENTSVCYFDSAATTQKPTAVLQAIDHYYRHHNANVHRAAHSLSRDATEAFEAARERVRRFINANTCDEIIWIRGTTEGINLVAHSYGQLAIGPGDEILISTMEHHANIVPWQLLAQRCGAHLRVIPLTDNGDLDLTAYQDLLNSRTKLVAICHVSNALGTVNPIAEVIQQAHQIGAKVLIDGAQAVSHMEVDVQALDCDFYLFSGHKLYGPTGIGVLYGKHRLLQQMPPWQGGGEMIEQVSFSQSRYQPPPLRFEAGTPNIAGAIGLAAAIDYLCQFDIKQRQAHEQRLINHASQQLITVPGLRIIAQPKQRVGLVPFVIDALHSFDLGALLDQQGFALRTGHHCTMPLHQQLGLEGTARLSFGLYNQTEEIDRLVTVLKQLVAEANTPALPSTSQSPQPASQLDPGQIDSAHFIPEQSLLQQLRALGHGKACYTLLMKKATTCPQQPGLRQDINLLHGCTSKVWLDHQRQCIDGNQQLSFRIDSDTRIIKGLGLLLCDLLNGMSPEQILSTQVEPVFRELGLERHLSASRTNGLHAMIEAIRVLAQP